MRGRRQILDLFQRWDGRDEEIPLAELTEALKGLVLEPDDLAKAVGFDRRSYRRTVIHGRDHYQALVLCWRSGQGSAIHDHLNSSCAVRVVEGRVTETLYRASPCGRLLPLGSEVHCAGSVTGCCGADIHQMANLEAPGNNLITLHVYSPPPAHWRSYRVSETTLADDDRLIRKPARTVRVDLGDDVSSTRPMSRKIKGYGRCTPETGVSLLTRSAGDSAIFDEALSAGLPRS
jgi:cysteine dioxygenase